MPPRKKPGDDAEPTPGGTARPRTRRAPAAKAGTGAEPAAKPAPAKRAARKPAAQPPDEAPAAETKPAPAKRAARKPAAAKKPAAQQTPPAGFVRADPPHFGPDAYTFLDPNDETRSTRSSYIRRGTLERWRSVVAFCTALQYLNPELEGKLPTTLAAFMDTALNELATRIEEEYNDGKPVRKVYELPLGPSKVGAARGAAIRAESRAKKTPSKDD